MILTLASIIVILLAIVAVVPSILVAPGIVLLVIGLPLVMYGGGIAGAIEVMRYVYKRPLVRETHGNRDGFRSTRACSQ